MATKRKALVTWLEDNGFEFERVNSAGREVYAHPIGGAVAVGSSPSDSDVNHARRIVAKALGLDVSSGKGKRSTSNVKDRAAQQRGVIRSAAAQHQDRVDKIEAIKKTRDLAKAEDRRVRNLQHGGAAVNMSNREIEALTRALEATEAEERYWRRQMTEGPMTIAH